MADELGNRGPQDRARININEDYEVRYWTRQFGCTEQKLRDAVRTVGVGAEAVARKLAGS